MMMTMMMIKNSRITVSFTAYAMIHKQMVLLTYVWSPVIVPSSLSQHVQHGWEFQRNLSGLTPKGYTPALAPRKIWIQTDFDKLLNRQIDINYRDYKCSRFTIDIWKQASYYAHGLKKNDSINMNKKRKKMINFSAFCTQFVHYNKPWRVTTHEVLLHCSHFRYWIVLKKKKSICSCPIFIDALLVPWCFRVRQGQ